VTKSQKSAEEQFEYYRDKASKATKKLFEAVVAACPGPHDPRQYRDGKPPWCAVCHRTSNGHHESEYTLHAQLSGPPANTP